MSPVQCSQSLKIGSHLETFGQPKRHNINQRFPTISVIMTPGSKGTPLTNFKKQNRSARQLSANSTILSQSRRIHITDPYLPLPMSIKTSLRHQRISHQLSSPNFSFAGFDKRKSGGIYSGPKFDPHKMMTRVLATKSLRHSEPFQRSLLI